MWHTLERTFRLNWSNRQLKSRFKIHHTENYHYGIIHVIICGAKKSNQNNTMMQTVKRIFINLTRLATGEIQTIQWAVVSANLLSFRNGKNEIFNQQIFMALPISQILFCLLDKKTMLLHIHAKWPILQGDMMMMMPNGILS